MLCLRLALRTGTLGPKKCQYYGSFKGFIGGCGEYLPILWSHVPCVWFWYRAPYMVFKMMYNHVGHYSKRVSILLLTGAEGGVVH